MLTPRLLLEMKKPHCIPINCVKLFLILRSTVLKAQLLFSRYFVTVGILVDKCESPGSISLRKGWCYALITLIKYVTIFFCKP